MHLYLVTLFCLYLSSACAAEKGTWLEYLPNRPVTVDSTLHLSIAQEIPFFPLKFQAEQQCESELKVISSSLTPCFEGPLKVAFEFKRLYLQMEQNGRKETFDSAHIAASPYLSAMATLAHSPLVFPFDRKLQLKEPLPQLDQLYQRLPIAAKMLPPSFFKGFFQNLFAISGEEIKIGQKRKGYVTIGIEPPVQMPVTFEISEISADAVSATWQGEMNSECSIPLPEPAAAKIGHAILTITLSGKGSWKKGNALIVDLTQTCYAKGKVLVKTAEDEIHWPLNIKVEAHIKSASKEEDGVGL